MAFRAVTYHYGGLPAMMLSFTGMAFRAVTYRNPYSTPRSASFVGMAFEQLFACSHGARAPHRVLQVRRFVQLLIIVQIRGDLRLVLHVWRFE